MLFIHSQEFIFFISHIDISLRNVNFGQMESYIVLLNRRLLLQSVCNSPEVYEEIFLSSIYPNQ